MVVSNILHVHLEKWGNHSYFDGCIFFKWVPMMEARLEASFKAAAHGLHALGAFDGVSGGER